MGSQAQDSKTQAAASAGAQAQDTQLAANAAQNQQFANNSRSSLFGTWNPTTNQYTGGTESSFLNPSSLNQTGLSGSFANLYGTQANQSANAAQQGVSTTLLNQAQHGMGSSPAGYDADQERQAYQQQASQNASNYATDFGNQNAQAVNQYNLANSMLSNNSTGAATNSIAGNSDAAGNYSSLYGTASQQVASPFSTAIGAIGTLAGAAANGASAYKSSCWVAAEIFGGWYEPRTVLVREWMFGRFAKSGIGKRIVPLYEHHGEWLAGAIRRYRPLRWILAPLFNVALRQARKGA